MSDLILNDCRSIVQRLAGDLREEFPGISGFSAQNLWRMRQLYETYAGSEKLSPLVREIGWTHNVIILMNCKDDLQREFYIRMTRRLGWTKNVLIHQFLPEFVGKMQFYLAVLDDQVRLSDESPSIGIILCKSKDKTIVEYALRESNKPIGVGTYRPAKGLKAPLHSPERTVFFPVRSTTATHPRLSCCT